MIDAFFRTSRIHSGYLNDAERDYLNRHISHCAYFMRANRFHSDVFACWKK
jgi:hypothetical protein